MGGRGGGRKRGGGGGGGEESYTDIMEKYGRLSNKDSISNRQAGVIYRAFKQGELEANEQSVNFLYTRLASDYPRYSSNRSFVDPANAAGTAVSALMAGDKKAAKIAFNEAVDSHFHFVDDMWFEKEKVKLK